MYPKIGKIVHQVWGTVYLKLPHPDRLCLKTDVFVKLLTTLQTTFVLTIYHLWNLERNQMITS